MIERFLGSNRPDLIEALLAQRLVEGDRECAEKLAELGEVIEVVQDTNLITQGAEDSDIYFILAGTFSIFVNDRLMTERGPGVHVGEMAAIEPSQLRSATVKAKSKSVVLKLSKPDLVILTAAFPCIWKRIAKELARRLEQRNRHVSSSRDKIRVFVMCSVEALPIAEALQVGLDHGQFLVTVWKDDVFQASHYPLESLENILDDSDFAVAIVQPDDLTTKGKKTFRTPRDNVIFELGLFIGRLGLKRSILVEPRGEEVVLPSDLKGVTSLDYKHPRDKKDLASALGAVCTKIKQIVDDLGARD